MDVEVTIEASKRRRVHWGYRVTELIGLLLTMYGLAASAWLIAILGVVIMLAIYAIYRRRHGADTDGDPGSARMGDDGGGGD